MGCCKSKPLTFEEQQNRCRERHQNIMILEQLTKIHCANFAPNEHVVDLQIAKQIAKYYQSFFPIYNQFAALDVIYFENLQKALKKHIQEYNFLFPDENVNETRFVIETSKNLNNSLNTYLMVICNVGLMCE